MANLLERCAGLPVREIAPGEVLVTEGNRVDTMFVMIEGSFDVASHGSKVATITEPGAVIGEISVLLDTDPGATVTAVTASKVHVVADPLAFMVGDPEALLAIARTLAGRLGRLVGYLADVKTQYASAGGHMELLDGILAELTFGEQPAVESGSERDPDPYY